MLDQNFNQIIQAALVGAEWAWSMIYHDLAGSVLGFLRVRGAADPEDLTGEVFLQVVRDLGSFQGDERAFRTWVFTITYHRLLDDVRYRTRRPENSGLDEIMVHVASQEDTEKEALQSLLVVRIRNLIGRLSSDQQDVLILRLIGQLTVEEVAQALGKRSGAVKALQRRGLESLRREMLKEGVTL